MNKSFNYKRFNYFYVEDNQLNHVTQYYRSLLRANKNKLPSPMSYIPVQKYAGNSYNLVFKSKYAAGMVGKFVYITLKYIKICSYLIQFIKKIISDSEFKKYRSDVLKIYNNENKLVFIKKLKHLFLLSKHKIRKKLKKQRWLLWRQFYQVQNTFWTLRVKRKIKSFIWKLFGKKYYIKRGIKYKSNWRRKLFFMNYDRISHIIYRLIKRKRLPKKLWYLLKKRKRKTKKQKMLSYNWFNIYKKNIKDRRFFKYSLNKIDYKFFVNSFKFNNKNSLENKILINNSIEKNDLFLQTINLLRNDINYLLPYFYTNNSLYENKLISSNHNFFSIFLSNYCLYLFFRSIYRKKIITQNKSFFLKWFYKYLSNTYKTKMTSKYYLQSGIVTKFYTFSKLSHTVLFIRLLGWFEKFYIDRDLFFYFVINKLFKNKSKINSIKNKFNILIKSKYKNSFYFLIKNKNCISSSIYKFISFNKPKIMSDNNKDNNKDNNEDYNMFITRKKGWLRQCFLPFVSNYKYIVQINKKELMNRQMIKKKYINIHRNKLYERFNKNLYKKKIFEFKKKYLLFNNILYKINLNTSNKLLINKIKKKIKKNNTKKHNFFIFSNDYKYNLLKENKQLKKKNKSRRFYGYNKKRKKIKFKKEYFLPLLKEFNIKNKKISTSEDQNIIDYDLINFFTKIKINRYWNLFLINKNYDSESYYKLNDKIKKKNLIRLQKYLFPIRNKYLILYKKYLLDFFYKINFIKKTEYNPKDKIIIQKINKYNKYNKYYKFKKRKTNKYINLFINYDNYYYNYLRNRKQKNLINLWIIKKQYRIINSFSHFRKIKYEFEIKTRFLEKKKFIFKFYSFYSCIYKELFVEYSRKLHSKNKLDEFERNFKYFGPLYFYYNKNINMSNIKNGIYIPSNIIIFSNFLINAYPKPFINTTNWITKIFMNHLFYPFQILYQQIDQYNYHLTINSNKKNKKSMKNIIFHTFFYKKWTIQRYPFN